MSEPNLSLGICDAEGCFANATEEIKMSVGQFGSIDLYICSNCKPKFDLPEEKEQTLSQVSGRDQSLAKISTTPVEPHLNDSY
jgi:hypothetical protein